MPAQAQRRVDSFLTTVTGTFFFGWLAGVLIVLKAWHLFHAPRWMMVSGAGYLTFMLGPILCGVTVARLAAHLARRGWRGASAWLLALGLAGLVAGFLVI